MIDTNNIGIVGKTNQIENSSNKTKAHTHIEKYVYRETKSFTFKRKYNNKKLTI